MTERMGQRTREEPEGRQGPCSYRAGVGLNGVAEVGSSRKLVQGTSHHRGHICQGLRQVSGR